MITAVDLLRGLAALIGLASGSTCPARPATSTPTTPPRAVTRSTRCTDTDLVCVHVEATDEASHEGNRRTKMKALEEIDRHIVGPLHAALEEAGRLSHSGSPDHPTPSARRPTATAPCRSRSPARASQPTRPHLRRRSPPASRRCRSTRLALMKYFLGNKSGSRRCRWPLHEAMRIPGICPLSTDHFPMPIVVQKFGGTSVADARRFSPPRARPSAPSSTATRWSWSSAPWATTPIELVDLAGQITDRRNAREMDMLLSTGEQVSVALMAMAIQSLGHEAISFTGAQIGIRTDSTHTKARIQSISTDRMRQAARRRQDRHRRRLPGHRRELQHHDAGPRRQRYDGRGAGGGASMPTRARSTPTSTASTPPTRGSARGRQVKRISYDEMLELASLGAGVMH